MAKHVVVNDSADDLIIVAFATDENVEPAEALHFQRAYQFSAQDRTLGMDQVYVERNDQSAGGYGGVAGVELRRDRIRVSLNEQTGGQLGNRVFEVGFTLPAAEYERLRDGLRRTFAGFGVLSEVAD